MSDTSDRVEVVFDFGAYTQRGSLPPDEPVYCVRGTMDGPAGPVSFAALVVVVETDAATWAAQREALASGTAYVREGDRAIPVRLAPTRAD